MAPTGSSFEALLRKAPQDEVGGIHQAFVVCVMSSGQVLPAHQVHDEGASVI